MSDHRRYKLKDYRFGLQLLALREKTRLTQIEVAGLVGVTERALQNWESGSGYPTARNLKKLIEIYVRRSAFTPRQERNEAKLLWMQAGENSIRHQIPFDELWFNTLLEHPEFSHLSSTQEAAWQEVSLHSSSSTLAFLPLMRNVVSAQTPSSTNTPSQLQKVDWGEAIDVSSFYGRENEVTELELWVLTHRCRLVALLGMGGIGKTALSIRFAQHVAPHFEYVFWRSLRNAPPLEEVLVNCIQFFADQQYAEVPQDVGRCITLLIEVLRKHRCLLVLDNVEVLLQENSFESRYRERYERYGEFIQRLAETPHQSCLLLTSREMPVELGPLVGTHAPVRALSVAGLGQTASQEMLRDKGLFGVQDAWVVLIHRYSGNPLALKIVAEAIRELFGGDIAAFLREGQILFTGIVLLLNQQFERLSALERDVMYWLAVERNPTSLEELNAYLLYPPSRGELLEALKSLRRRSLIERVGRGAVFTLQPVVLEYVTARLVEQVSEEVRSGSPSLLRKYALMRGQAKEYIRNSQLRLIVQPILEKLGSHFGSKEFEEQVMQLTNQLRGKPYAVQGYGGGNLVNLLAALKGNIRGANFSRLLIRQAYLQGIEAQGASFAESDLTESVFIETFDSIASVTFSPNGKYIACGSFNGEIRLWYVVDGKPLLAFMGHTRMVWSLAFSPDSTLLASVGYDHSVKLWRVDEEGSVRCLKTLQGHTEWLRSVVFHPDESIIATCGDDETIRLWNVQSGLCLNILRGNAGMVWDVAFSPDGHFLLSGNDNGTLKLWEVSTGLCLRTLPAHLGRVYAVAWSVGGMFASGGEDQDVKVWEAESGQLLNTLRGHTNWVWSLAFDAENVLASGGDDGTIKLWESRSGQCLRTLQGHIGRIWSLAVGPDGNLASGTHGGTVKLWETTSGQCLRTLQGHHRVICSVLFSPDGGLLVNGDNTGTIRIWQSEGQEREKYLKAWQGHVGRVWSLAFHPRGRMLVTGGNDRVVKLWEVPSGRCLKTFLGHTGEIWSVAFCPDGGIVASASLDGTVRLWRVGEESEDCLKVLEGHNAWVWSVAFSPDGQIVASGSADGVVKLWNVSSGLCFKTLRGKVSPIGALAFSSDGKLLFSSSNDELVKVWDVSCGVCLKTFQGDGRATWIRSVAFNHERSLIATGSNDQTVTLWGVREEEREKPVRTLVGHAGQVWSVAFSPNDSILASGSDDGTMRLWNVQDGTCLASLQSDRPYERMNIRSATGITDVQKASLKELGAIEKEAE